MLHHFLASLNAYLDVSHDNMSDENIQIIFLGGFQLLVLFILLIALNYVPGAIM